MTTQMPLMQQDPQQQQQRPTGIQALAALGQSMSAGQALKQQPLSVPGYVAPSGGGYHTDQVKIGGVLPVATGNTGAVGGGQTWGGGDQSTRQTGYPTGYQNTSTYDPNAPNSSAPAFGGYTAPAGSTGYVPGQSATASTFGMGAAPSDGSGAGGQKTLQSGAFYTPDAQNNAYQDAAVADDANAQNIYGVINNEINGIANTAAPQIQNAATYGGAQLASPQMTTGAKLDTGQDQQYAGAQNAQINQLAQIASGNGPSVAAVTAQQQRDANVAASMAMLGSQRGASSAGLGLRQAAMGAATADQQAAQQATLGRAQEATAAQQQLTAALSGARGQSQSTATTQANLAQAADLSNQSAYNQAAATQAGYTQQAGLADAAAQNQISTANQSAALQQNQLNNQAYQSGLSSYMGQNEQDIQNTMSVQQQIANEELQKYGIDQGVGVQQAQMGIQAGGAGLGALGALAMMSDRRRKRDVEPGTQKIRSLLEIIGAAR
jgi:hypothetical protein